MKNSISIISLCALTLLTAGCSTTEVKKGEAELKCKYKSDGSWECEAGVRYPLMVNIFKPVLDIVASSGLFSYDDWIDLEPADFSIEISDSQSSTYVNGALVKIDVFSGGQKLASKSFSTNKSGADIKLSDPNAVKNWGNQFIDIADEVKYQIILTAPDSGTISVLAQHKNNTIAATSFYQKPPFNDNEDPR